MSGLTTKTGGFSSNVEQIREIHFVKCKELFPVPPQTMVNICQRLMLAMLGCCWLSSANAVYSWASRCSWMSELMILAFVFRFFITYSLIRGMWLHVHR